MIVADMVIFMRKIVFAVKSLLFEAREKRRILTEFEWDVLIVGTFGV
jgi:hypothetical protein